MKPPLILAALSILALAASMTAGAAPDARTAFARGNQLLNQGRQMGGDEGAALLAQAAEQYRACLSQQSTSAPTDPLQVNAQYNLEMTRLLLTQLGHADKAGTEPTSSSPSGKSSTPSAPAQAAGATHANGQKTADPTETRQPADAANQGKNGKEAQGDKQPGGNETTRTAKGNQPKAQQGTRDKSSENPSQKEQQVAKAPPPQACPT